MEPADVQRFALLLMVFGAALELSAVLRRTAGLGDGLRELGYPAMWVALLLGAVGLVAAFDRGDGA